MKKKGFTPEQIITMLREAEVLLAPSLCVEQAVMQYMQPVHRLGSWTRTFFSIRHTS
jgi:hypothetical protein